MILSFSAAVVTVLNVYVPQYLATIGGEKVGYFVSPAQFDEVYETLVKEKEADGLEVKVYLTQNPEFELTYVRDNVIEEQNQYTNLRAFVQTEYTIYEVCVNNKVEMTFASKSEADNYAKKLKSSIKTTIPVAVKTEIVNDFVTTTSAEKAKTKYNDLVSRYKPVVRVTTYSYSGTQYSYTKTAGELGALMSGGCYVTEGSIVTQYFSNINAALYASSTYRHSGTDIASLGYRNVRIFSYKEGTVVVANNNPNNSSLGCYVIISHGVTSDGIEFRTSYAHLQQNSICVNVGDKVSQGQMIGRMGTTGYSTGVHLHLEFQTIKNNIKTLHDALKYMPMY
jgi:murein DD-endopeptidase MepM/ murein hydrolase activator NlpD